MSIVIDRKSRAAESPRLNTIVRFRGTRRRRKARVIVGALRNAAAIIPTIRNRM
jgi:hypothetical protein